jgi:BA14K-like protein
VAADIRQFNRFLGCLRQSRQWQHLEAKHARRQREVHETSYVFVLLKQENKMRVGKFLSVGLIAVMFSAPAISAPLQGAIGNSMAAPSTTEKVWCRNCGGGDGGAGLGALIGGVVGGVIAAGAVSAAASQNAANDAAAQQHAAACAQRYHSYDPASNTFQAKDGRRLPCQ